MEVTEKRRESFWKRVDKRAPDECWPWTGGTQESNARKPPYGVCWMDTANGPKLRAATHTALAIEGKPRPSPKHFALHSCDNPICVNPAHLRWGTQWENVKDALERGNLKRLFTDEEAAEIRSDPRGPSQIAADYGCSAAVICSVKSGRTYKKTLAEV